MSKLIEGRGTRSILRDPCAHPRPPQFTYPLGAFRGGRTAPMSTWPPVHMFPLCATPPGRALPGLHPPGLHVALHTMQMGGGAASDLGVQPHPLARHPCTNLGEEGPWHAASRMACDPPLAYRLHVQEGDGGAKGGCPSHSCVGPHLLSQPPVMCPPLSLHAAQALHSMQRGVQRGWYPCPSHSHAPHLASAPAWLCAAICVPPFSACGKWERGGDMGKPGGAHEAVTAWQLGRGVRANIVCAPSPLRTLSAFQHACKGGGCKGGG